MANKVVPIRPDVDASCPAPSVLARAISAASMSAADAEYTAVLFGLFRNHLIGTHGQLPKSADQLIGILHQLLAQAQVAPWHWTSLHVDAFVADRVEVHEVGVSRQSAYFGAFRAFQGFLFTAPPLLNEIHRRFGVQVQPFFNSENAIAFKRRKKNKKGVQVQAMTVEHVRQLRSAFDDAIAVAIASCSKGALPIQRDLAITIVALLTGLRLDELLSLRTTDWRADPRYPRFEGFAQVHVRKGKGHKPRVVPLLNPLIVTVMKWYLEHIRPQFLSERLKDPYLLFPSERAGKLTQQPYRDRLREMGELAGLPFRLKPYALRHTFATQMAEIVGPKALQEMLGHAHLSTTLCTYYHPDLHRMGNEIAAGMETVVAAYEASQLQGL